MRKRRLCDHCGAALVEKPAEKPFRHRNAKFCQRACQQAYLDKLRRKLGAPRKR
jgi:GTP-dependent phosphoenolpyruvate carboxykinase